MKSKVCTSCDLEQEIANFTPRKGTNWRNAYCKKCMSKRAIEWRNKNRERFNAYQSAYWKKRRLNSI